jgi:thiol:disulfide interchange protein/DsbC/DsbD-like thiol-disulfide interchange protein
MSMARLLEEPKSEIMKRLSPCPLDASESIPKPVTRLRVMWAVACLVMVIASAAEAVEPVEPKAPAAEAPGRQHIDAQLVLDPGGRQAGILFDLAPGWHLYWRNPGETGLATELSFSAAGTRFTPLPWPAPRRFESPDTGLVSYGYEDRVLIASRFDSLPETGVLRAEADVLICKSECIPVEFEWSEPIHELLAGAEPVRAAALFKEFETRHPVLPSERDVVVDAHYSRSHVRPGDAFEFALAIKSCASRTASCSHHRIDASNPRVGFFPGPGFAEDVELVAEPISTTRGTEGQLLLSLRASLAPEAEGTVQRLEGVLGMTDAMGRPVALVVDLPFPHAPSDSESAALGRHWLVAGEDALDPAPGDTDLSVLHVLLLALLGGFLINGMPCVLPVLGIKICAIAELAHRDRRELRRHGVAYGLGILLSMSALALVVIGLQAAGTRVGWGFQFQEPIFVAIVSAVVVLFALNLFGVFEIQLASARLDEIGREASGVSRSFFDGLLAVILATPCTAPFLGTAVGFAFAEGPAMIVCIFLTIGLGLAAPYGLVCLIPGWARFIPKPGNWMLRLRTGLGFLLLSTAVWLVWIFGQSTGVNGVTQLLSLLVALSFGSWLLGQVQRLQQPRAILGTSGAVLLVAIGGLNLIHVKAEPSSALPETRQYDDGWIEFDPQAIEATLASGRPVFVSFTADWCITCKVNEKMVLDAKSVRRELAGQGFATYRGDWTRRDEVIRKELARHGRAGVPLYLVYDPRQPNRPQVLPEILDASLVIGALSRASGGLETAAAQ